MHAHQHRGRIAAVVGLLAGLLLGQPSPANAQRQSSIQLAPESNRYFISKDVGEGDAQERWAITYNLDDGTVTGNVYPVNGGAPTFVNCNITRVEQAPDPANAQYYLECRFAGPCASAPCANQWGEPMPVGPLAGSFLLPTNTRATYAGNVQPIYNVSCSTSAQCHGNGANYVILSPGLSYDNTVLVESNGVNGMQGPFIAPFDPGASFLLKKLDGTGAGELMPYNGSPLPADQVDAVRNWILEGAANN